MSTMRGIGAVLFGLGVFSSYNMGNIDTRGLDPVYGAAEATGLLIGSIIWPFIFLGIGSYLLWKSRRRV